MKARIVCVLMERRKPISMSFRGKPQGKKTYYIGHDYSITYKHLLLLVFSSKYVLTFTIILHSHSKSKASLHAGTKREKEKRERRYYIQAKNRTVHPQKI